MHSTASTWKYLRTEKVKAVDGLDVEAGKRQCWNSCVPWSGAPLQQHQLTSSWWTFKTSTITNVLVSLGSHASRRTSSTSSTSSFIHDSDLAGVFAGQGDPPWPRWSLNPSACNEVFLKNSPVHFSIEWKGEEEWTSRQQVWQRNGWPKQSRHWNSTALVVHCLQEWSGGRYCKFRYSWINLSLRGIHSERRLFWVCTLSC